MILSAQGEETGTIAIRSNYGTSAPMVITPDGTLYNSQRLDSGTDITESVTGFAPLFEDESRTGEPVAPPDLDYESPSLVARQGGGTSISMVPYAPRVIWTLSPSGARIAGISEDYSFDVRHPDGNITRVTKSWDPVLVDPDEADWQRRLATARMRRTQPDWTWNGPPIPGHKPAYTRFLPDHAGRIWVHRPGPSPRAEGDCIENPDVENLRQAGARPCWGAAGSTWEVFDEEGRFLGSAQIPENVQTFLNPYITEDYFLASSMDDLGTVMVKRFRIVRPAD